VNWNDLRYFLALSRNNSLSEAGRVSGVKHTTVARRIHALEESLNTRLFDRLPSGYTMTQAGENLYQHALTMEEQAHAVNREAFGLDSQLKGDLTLTASHDVFTSLVVPFLGQFNRTYPDISLQLASSTGLVDLAARQADIALRMTATPPDYLIGKKVLPLCHGIYASNKYLKKNPTPSHLILWNDNLALPDWAKQHFPEARSTIKASDIATLLACVNNHHGIARLPCYIADRQPHLRRIDVPLTPSAWGVWVLSHVDLRETARVRACREFLIDIIEQQNILIEGLNSRYHC